MSPADTPPAALVERDAAFTMPARLVLWGCIVKYGLLVGYGLVATAKGIPTFALVAGPLLELVWPVSIALLASLALAGVIRSWNTCRTGFELQVTRALVAVFTAYSAALVFRFILRGDAGSAALAFLPLVLLVFPTLRIIGIGIWRRGRIR